MEEKDKKFEIDGNAIVSPKNTKKLYGQARLDQEEPEAGQTEDTPVTLPDSTDDVDENMFPSAA